MAQLGFQPGARKAQVAIQRAAGVAGHLLQSLEGQPAEDLQFKQFRLARIPARQLLQCTVETGEVFILRGDCSRATLEGEA